MFKSEWLKRQDIMLSFVANSFAAKVLLIVNKIILFWFLFFNSGRYNNKKTGDYQEQRRMGLRMFGPKLFLTPHICEIFSLFLSYQFFHSRSRSRVFLGMIASDSHSRNVGMDFFIPFSFLNLPFHRRESKWELEFCERYQTFNIFSFLYIYNNLYWGGKMSLLVSDWKDREFCSVLLQIVMLQRC